jgi:Carboxypeptidase regulatory-like domain/TonB-dependent Receptor Plug Domain
MHIRNVVVRCVCNLLPSRLMRHPALCTAALLLCAWALPAPAQTRLEGVVRDDSGAVLPGVRVELWDNLTRERVRSQETDRGGRFAFRVRQGSGYRLHATRIGYLATDSSLLVPDDRRTLPVEFRLVAQPLGLEAIDVVARARSPAVLNGFQARQRTGMGHYLTREDLDRMRPAMVTDALARVPGVRLESGGGSSFHRRIRMSRSSARGYCPVQVFVDGMLINRGSSRMREASSGVDDTVSIDDVEGIEVYRGLSSVPAEFLNEDSRCGVVVIWTRRGG